MFILVLGWMMGQQKISLLSALGLGLGVAGVAMLTGAELTVKGRACRECWRCCWVLCRGRWEW